MAEITLPKDGNLTPKQTIENAIVYSNLAGRKFDPDATIKVYFMPATAMVNGAQVPYKPYTDTQVAADATLAEVNASYKAI